MKKMKRLVAVLLVGIMALAMLTACGVTPSAPSMRDTALEESVAQWTVELGRSKGLELTLDSELTEISNKCLPTAVNVENARLASAIDRNTYDDALKEQKTFFAAAKKGKKAALVPVTFESGIEVTENTLANRKNDIWDKLRDADVNNPTKFGVTVTKQKEYTLVLFVVSE
jgi:hypothetical protein